MEGLVSKSLVVGASGLIGAHLLTALQGRAIGTYREHPRPGLIPLDVTDRGEFDAVVREHRPQVIYLAACMANVDYCQTHPDATYPTNVLGVRNALEVANRHHCKLVYLSSEYVFDGRDGPYDELAATNPLSVYGWQKVAGERRLEAFAHDWLVVRTTVVYGRESQGKNFLYRLRGALQRGERIRVPEDQVSSPTYAPDLVQATIDLVENDARGVFNVTGRRIVNRYEFATAAANAFGLDAGLIDAVETADLAQAARRPLRAGLLTAKVEAALGRPMADFTDSLRDLADALH